MKRVLNLTMLVALLTGTTALISVADDAKPISDGMKVTMDYKVSVPEKEVSMSTEGRGPVSYVQGSGQMNPALETALYGLKPGDTKRVVVPPEQGFGKYDDTKKITVAKNKLPSEIQEGMILHDSTGALVTVAGIKDDSVVLDLNHPLAGQNLVFDVHVLTVEQATGSDR